MVALVGVLWGLNWPTVKFLLSEITPLSLRAFGFSSAAIALIAITKAMGHRLKPAPGEATSLVLTGVFVLFGFNILTAFGQLVMPATVAAISTLVAPVVGVMSSVLLLGEGISWHKSLALVLIVVSIAMSLWRPNT